MFSCNLHISVCSVYHIVVNKQPIYYLVWTSELNFILLRNEKDDNLIKEIVIIVISTYLLQFN